MKLPGRRIGGIVQRGFEEGIVWIRSKYVVCTYEILKEQIQIFLKSGSVQFILNTHVQ